MNRGRLKSFVVIILTGLSSGLFAASEGPVSQSLFGVAIGGMDPVAYHEPVATVSRPAVPGRKTWTHEWRGAKWRFSSKENFEKFRADPERFRPAYGGHCANALSLGEGLIKTDGSHWEIFDDRLFLFFASRGRERWTGGDWAAFRRQADRAWLDITGHED